MFGEDEDNSAAIWPGLELRKVTPRDQRELNSQEKKLKRALVRSTMLLASGWKESKPKHKPLRHFQWKGEAFVLPVGWQRAVSTWWDHQLESRDVNGPVAAWDDECFFVPSGFCIRRIADSGFLFPWYECEPDPDLTRASSFGGLVKMGLWCLHLSLGEKVSMLANTFSLLFGSNDSFLVVQNTLILDIVNVVPCAVQRFPTPRVHLA